MITFWLRLIRNCSSTVVRTYIHGKHLPLLKTEDVPVAPPITQYFYSPHGFSLLFSTRKTFYRQASSMKTSSSQACCENGQGDSYRSPRSSTEQLLPSLTTTSWPSRNNANGGRDDSDQRIETMKLFQNQKTKTLSNIDRLELTIHIINEALEIVDETEDKR